MNTRRILQSAAVLAAFASLAYGNVSGSEINSVLAPEPATLALAGLGLLFMFARRACPQAD